MSPISGAVAPATTVLRSQAVTISGPQKSCKRRKRHRLGETKDDANEPSKLSSRGKQIKVNRLGFYCERTIRRPFESCPDPSSQGDRPQFAGRQRVSGCFSGEITPQRLSRTYFLDCWMDLLSKIRQSDGDKDDLTAYPYGSLRGLCNRQIR